jgi:adenine-specific DNA-methyltransferase
MAKIEDLIAQIPDERLRKGIAAEVKALKKTKKFGLVFEEHLPETVRLPRLPVKAGELVALKHEAGNELWRVKEIHKGVATCERAIEGYPSAKDAKKEFPVSDLVVVRNFGDPIYPALVPVDRVERGGPDRPWHLLINADNFHALQLLLYCYEGQVDVAYIDPPYNTGAKDWKYNNDYVDATDTWRHSKWLSMMKKRLMLARRLLSPSGVLICAVDDYEIQHLICLLEELFPSCVIETLTVIHHPQGAGGQNLSRVHEYAVFCVPKGVAVKGNPVEHDEDEWSLQRSGTDRRNFRHGRPNQFYALHLDPVTLQVVGVGPRLERNEKYSVEDLPDGQRRIYPVDKKGNERVWRYERDTMIKLIASGSILRTKKGAFKVRVNRSGRHDPIFTVWTESQYNAGIHGSSLLESILGRSAAFSYPKSLYSVVDCIATVVRDQPNALVLDFFAGSGTTYHAVSYLNLRDDGQRRCILVTNNEVEEELARRLMKAGHCPGDVEYEKHGICESATWPRCKFITNGKRDDDLELPGEHLNERELKDGFEENLEYFRLDFLDPSAVARGDAFAAILPILWMMAGCRGKREDSKGSQSWFIPKHAPFAVLIREKEFRSFRREFDDRQDIEWVFLVTDSEENFGLMRRALGRKYRCVQLYKSYLENFRLNTPEALGQGGAA